MPYKVVKGAGCPTAKPFGVVKIGDGKRMGCHADAGAARKQVAALYAQEQQESTADASPGVMRGRDVLTASEAKFDLPVAGSNSLPTAEIVIIRPGESANRRFYSAEAISQAVSKGFWNGSPMFIDHGDPKAPKARKALDLVAGITDTWVGAEGEARGHVRFYNPAFASFAQEAKEHLGVSAVHDFRGQRYRGNDGHYHERVDELVERHSVDWVAFPAAGGGIAQFLSAQESEDDMEIDWGRVTAEDLREHAPTVFEQIVGEAREGYVAETPASGEGEGDPPAEPPAAPAITAGEAGAETAITVEQVRAIAAEAVTAALRADRDARAQEATVRGQVAEKLASSGLPEKTRTRIAGQFDGSSEFVETTVQEAIDSAKAEIAEVRRVPGPRPAGLGSSSPAADGASAPKSGVYPALEAMTGVMAGKTDSGAGGDGE